MPFAVPHLDSVAVGKFRKCVVQMHEPGWAEGGDVLNLNIKPGGDAQQGYEPVVASPKRSMTP